MAKAVKAVKTASGRVVKQRLTNSLFKLEIGTALEIEVTGKIYVGKPQKNAKADDKPADIMPCINLDTGEEGAIIVPAVLMSVLKESFPKDNYVGACFSICKREKKDPKDRYFPYDIMEIEA
jgi:hypothetical protein